MPLDRIILETDTPYVKPEWCIEKWNTSLNIPRIAIDIAELKNISAEEVESVTTANVENLFGI
ncbi:MAG: TatD family hydrolase [Ruminococcus sp.]|nr:TatD family hydrolase [Ruminococcus sp.]